jgi:hypothetical protein
MLDSLVVDFWELYRFNGVDLEKKCMGDVK